MTITGLKVLGFDCFNTIFRMDKIERNEIKDYAKATVDKIGVDWEMWSPSPVWYELDAHPDARAAIEAMRRSGYICATMSNGPVDLLHTLSRRNFIQWDMITPIQLKRVWKRSPEAYLTLCDLFRVKPSEVGIVTANRTFGDVEVAESLGMRANVIRDESSEYRSLWDLYKDLEVV